MAKIQELIPDNKNLNKGTEFGNSLIEKSLRKFGAGRSILIDKNNRIIAGNKTIENASAIGLDDLIIVETSGDKIVAVKRTDIDLDTPQGRELALADNATSKANLDWDIDNMEEIAAEFDIQVGDWGVDDSEWKEIEEAEEDDYEIPDTIETDIVLGDLFEIGEHRLLCGDSTQTDTFEKLMNEELADLVLTDPPYNVNYEGGTKDKLKIMNDKKTDSEFYQFLYDFYTAQGTYTKAGGAWYIWHASSEVVNFGKAFIESGLLLKQQLIWVKNSMVMGRQDYQWKHEPCLYGWKEGAAHGWYSDRKQTTILEFDRPNRNSEHPTMKPVALFSYQIGNSSKQGDVVCDAFAGSGTTMVACHQMNRRAYCIEQDPKYCQVIIDRMRKLDPTLLIKRNGEPIQ